MENDQFRGHRGFGVIENHPHVMPRASGRHKSQCSVRCQRNHMKISKDIAVWRSHQRRAVVEKGIVRELVTAIAYVP